MGINFPNSPAQSQVFSSTGGAFIYLDGVWRFMGTQQVTAQAYNRIVNGAMQISQANGTTAGTISGYFATDQFYINFTSSGTFTHQWVQVATPNGSVSRIRITVNTADVSVAASDLLSFATTIEGVRIADFFYGTASAKQSILRFGWKSPAGTYSVSLRNSANTRSYVTNFTISVGQANTDTEQVFVIPGDVTGTWLTDIGVGIFLWVTLATGTTYQAPSTGWNAGNFIGTAAISNGMGTAGNVFELFDVGLYLDPQNSGVAPRWQMPDYAEELRACQRYYFKNSPITTGSVQYATGSQTNAFVGFVPFHVPMRTTPAVGVVTSPAAVNSTNLGFIVDAESAVLHVTVSATGGYNFSASGTYSFSARL
jgi:hypothetical protein